ncbi:hypothetical protein OEW28_14020 [Defluviimonas sp. WL0002]|uniref:Uncharacterized protein n=1 Tax=Albidovulum marisflavi TaxID=2984159 RepID=A0ABT2ZF50_9RHOB|nr:hypothetical protein [Defluviimonas sp. WL0002]MCV2869747.1 hypothetical protein [Defluviimonas sp. WL0002]
MKAGSDRIEPRLARPGAWAGLWRTMGCNAVTAAEMLQDGPERGASGQSFTENTHDHL